MKPNEAGSRFASHAPGGLQASLRRLVLYVAGLAVLVSTLVGTVLILRYAQAEGARTMDALRQGVFEVFRARLRDDQLMVDHLAADITLLDGLSGLSHADSERDAAIRRAIALRLARVGPAVKALVVAYDRDGLPVSYYDGRSASVSIGVFLAGSAEAGLLGGQLAEPIRRDVLRLQQTDFGWRMLDGAPCPMLVAPVADIDSGPGRVGYVAVLACKVERELELAGFGVPIRFGWRLPDGRTLGAANGETTAEALDSAPTLSAEPTGKLAADAGRYETPDRLALAFRLPVDGGKPPYLLAQVDKRQLAARADSLLWGALAAALLALGIAVPTGLWQARRRVMRPVRQLREVVETAREGDRGLSDDYLAEHGRDEFGSILAAIADMTNTAHDHAEAARLWASVFDKTRDAIFITDAEGIVTYANRALLDVTGMPPRQVVGRLPGFVRAEMHDESFYASFWQTLRAQGHWSGEVWDQKADGTTYPLWLSMSAITDDKGATTHYVGIFNDISERKEQEARINYLAHHDSLTGLPNRALLRDRMMVALAHADRDQHLVALLFIDLDRFKTINDTLGHMVGDGLLQTVAERLKRAVRASDTVCRLGGDEFIVMLNKVRNVQDAELVAEHIIAVLAPVARVGGHDLSITPSIGVAMYPADAADADELIRKADVAMYQAKALGRNNYQVFVPAMTDAAAESLSLEQSLRQAVDRDEFSLHFQPQIDIATRKLVGVEALVRWTSAEFGPVSPAKFIPLAEETGLILQIGDWVMREACRQRAEWTRAGLGSFPVAVNVSSLQFRQPEFARRVQEAMQLFGVQPAELELELTESIVMQEADATSRSLEALRTLGVGLAVDDFGTGYSSLGYLKRLPIAKLKVDGSFVKDIERDAADRAIVEAIVSLGRALGLTLVAEGVENRGALGVLSKLGCHQAQGYYYCRPLPAEEFERWLSEFTASDHVRRLQSV